MHNYFESTIKYEKTSEEGKIVKVTEKYLIEALSFTEAEGRIIEEMKPFISGEFEVAKLANQKINEIFGLENQVFEGDKWYKSKLSFISFDEEKGIERKTAIYVLIRASDIKEARESLVEGMRVSMADYEIESITETKIIEVFKYKPINE